MRYANKESRHGEEPAAPGIRNRRGPGGRVADMSLADTHSTFSVPTDGQKSGPHVPKSADGKAPGEQLMFAGRVRIGMPIKEVALRVSLLGHAAQNRGVMWTTGVELAAFRV